jgi:hypothetical protein
MPPSTWAEGEQLDFLESRLPEYRQLQPTKKYTHFWAHLFEDWFSKWPEEPTLFLDKPEGTALTKEENELLGNAQRARRQVRLRLLLYGVELKFPIAAPDVVSLSNVSNSKQKGSHDI